jgi:hypothetical protein
MADFAALPQAHQPRGQSHGGGGENAQFRKGRTQVADFLSHREPPTLIETRGRRSFQTACHPTGDIYETIPADAKK